MGNPQKAKGDAYERDLAKYFNENIYKEERCSRAPLSGGGRIGIGSSSYYPIDFHWSPFFAQAIEHQRL